MIYTICLNCGYIEPNYNPVKKSPCCDNPTPRTLQHVCPVPRDELTCERVYISWNNHIGECMWVLGIEEYAVEVLFCPFCGQKLDALDKVEEE